MATNGAPAIQVAFTLDPTVSSELITKELESIVSKIPPIAVKITADTTDFENQIRTAAANALQNSGVNGAGINIPGAATKAPKLTKAQIKQLADQRRIDMGRATAARATMAEQKLATQQEKDSLRAAETQNRLLMRATDLQIKYGEALRTTFMPDGKSVADALNDLNAQFESGQINAAEYAKSFGNIERTMKPLVQTSDTLGSKLKNMFSRHFELAAVMLVIQLVRRVLSQIYQNVKEIDLAMTELKKVTDETASSYDAFMNRAGDTAAQLGTTMSNFINATADFARLGYSLAESEELAKVAVVYKNVGDGIESIGDASESVISSMKAFNVAAADSMSIIDKFNAVGNTQPISSAGIGEVLQRSASALAVANNTIDEAVALAAAGNSVVQNPQQVGEHTRPMPW